MEGTMQRRTLFLMALPLAFTVQPAVAAGKVHRLEQGWTIIRPSHWRPESSVRTFRA
jgi:hypothetical protein